MDKCDDCPHRRIVRHKVFETLSWDVCGNQCGEFAANRAHPLSPCVQWECDEDEDAICMTDELSIIAGHRCPLYCAWLDLMRKEKEKQ